MTYSYCIYNTVIKPRTTKIYYLRLHW